MTRASKPRRERRLARRREPLGDEARPSWALERALAGPGQPSGPIRWKAGGFTPDKQRKFFKWLAKTGCKKDAAGKAGISKTTVDRWRNRDPAFDARFDATIAMASGELEAIAYQRATEGAEEQVIRDGRVAFVRKKPSDAMLRTLLQGANPKKYGSGGFGAAHVRRLRLKIEKELRPKLKLEIQREMEEARPSGIEETRERLAKRLMRLRQQMIREGKLEGWTVGPGEMMLPPGWVMVRREAAEAAGIEIGRPED
jgi:hypothetical protein